MKLTMALFVGIAASLAAADLSGTVVAEHDGSAVVGSAISVSSGGKVVAELETDASGVFRAKLPAAEYVVTATKSSFTTAERRIPLTDAGADVVLQLTKLGVISGRVIDTRGNGIRNMVVAAIPAPTDGGPLRVFNSRPKGAATDASGRYRIFGLPAGDYVAVALAGNARNIANVPNGVPPDSTHGSTADFYPSGKSPLVLRIRTGEEHPNIDFNGYNGPLFSIRGTVNGPAPDTDYRLTLVAESAAITLGTSIARPGNEFAFDRVAPGTYRIVASRVISNNGIIELINSGQLVITSANEAAIRQELERVQATIPPEVLRAEPAFAETTVTVAQNVTGVSLSARPGVQAQFLYQPANGCPTSTQMSLNPIEYFGGSTSRKLEAGTGWTPPAMPPALYSVVLDVPESSGCYAVTSLIDFKQVTPGSTVPIVVGAMGSVQGKVDTTGFQTGDFTVNVATPDGVIRRTVSLTANATFSIPNLRPGTYRINLSRRSATRVVAADQNVVVESGSTAQVDFPALP